VASCGSAVGFIQSGGALDDDPAMAIRCISGCHTWFLMNAQW